MNRKVLNFEPSHLADMPRLFLEPLYEIYQQLLRHMGAHSETEIENFLLECNAAEVLGAFSDSETAAVARQARF